MQIYVENAQGKYSLPIKNGKHGLLFYNNILILDLYAQEEISSEINGLAEEYHGPGEFAIPLIWDKTSKCLVTLRNKEWRIKYSFHLENTSFIPDEDIINLFKFVSQLEDTFRIGQYYPVEELYLAIKEDKVSLIIEKTPYTGYDDQSLLKKISETVPMVMDICSHPKQSLRSEEAILDVNLVKRINSRTMDHLASHSEHWKARTLNGLIPNRLRADIFEDDINIYENLFFRMAIDDILKYVHRQAVSIEKTIEQNDNAIDWNAYGEALYDYKRMRIFDQLLPNYDVSERQTENRVLRDLFLQWEKLEKNFSTVEASQFYRSIDKKKHIGRNIKPTNILKKDSRYNALYRLWCEIQRKLVQEQQESINLYGENDVKLSDCYSMYTAVLLLFVFKLLECDIDKKSTFRLGIDGSTEINAVFKSESMNYVVKSSNNKYGTLDISITYVEKVSYEYCLPKEVYCFLDEIKSVIPDQAFLDEQKKTITFFAKPSKEKQREIKNLFHLSQVEQKGLSSSIKEDKKEADKVWRQELENIFAAGVIKDARTETIHIISQYALIDKSENAVEKFTGMTLDFSENTTVYLLPITISDYRKNVKSEKLLCRLLNYGEKYHHSDAVKWGNYKAGIIPVSQIEINSALRLMKLVSLHSSRLQIKWNDKITCCPICGFDNCQEESANNWKCRNPECGVLFGITKHAEGCGKEYEWTRPFINIKKNDIDTQDYIDLLLKKEIIFDRLAITDFDFEEQQDRRIRYIPVCPKCGKRDNI